LPYDPKRCKFLTDNEREAILANRVAEGDGGHARFKWKYLRQVLGGGFECILPGVRLMSRLQSVDVHVPLFVGQHCDVRVSLRGGAQQQG
jgi:hypothetical protein